MVDSNQFHRCFPYLKSIGINTIDEVKDKLKFKGKINSNQTCEWKVIGISYNYYVLTQINLTISNNETTYKIIYTEDTPSTGVHVPNLATKNKDLLHIFQIKVINKPAEIIHNTDNIEIFPTKKAS